MARYRNPSGRLRTRALRAGALAEVVLAASSLFVVPEGFVALASAASYPVTVTSCGVPVTFDKAPTRAVSNDINTTEELHPGAFGLPADGS